MWLFQPPSFCSTDDGSSFTLQNLLRLKLDWIIGHKFWVHLSLSSAKEEISLLRTPFSNQNPKKRSIIFPCAKLARCAVADVALWWFVGLMDPPWCLWDSGQCLLTLLLHLDLLYLIRYCITFTHTLRVWGIIQVLEMFDLKWDGFDKLLLGLS